jgi:hypothetical protein
MKTILGTEIPETTRGILYLCKFTRNKLKVIHEVFFTKAWMALEAYANIPNPESQVIMGKTYEELIENLAILHKDMKNPDWLKELSDCL